MRLVRWLLSEGAPLTCTLTSNRVVEQQLSTYALTLRHYIGPPHTTYIHIHIHIALHFGVRDEHRNICQMFAGFIVPVLRLPICVRDTKRKRDKERSELTVTKARRQWKCFLFNTRKRVCMCLCLYVCMCVSLFLPTSRVHVQLPIGPGVVSGFAFVFAVLYRRLNARC